jgi:hypothetical protein
VQLLAIAIAASLVGGPAPVDSETEVPNDAQADEADPSLTDLVEAPEDRVEPEERVEPVEIEPEPEPVIEPLPPSVVAPVEPAPIVRDRLGCDGSKSCRRMTVVGIVVGTLGLAAVGTGIGLLVKRDEVIPESPIFVTSTRPAGVVTVTLGAGVSLTAVLMLVAAHRGYKQQDQQARVELIGNGLRF